jgi:hypothetical protein
MSEFELAACLSRVEAPNELWDRIQTPARPRRTASPLLAAAAVFIVSVASTAWYVSRQAPSPPVKPVISRGGACANCHLS